MVEKIRLLEPEINLGVALLLLRKGEDLKTDPFCLSGAELRKAGLMGRCFLKVV